MGGGWNWRSITFNGGRKILLGGRHEVSCPCRNCQLNSRMIIITLGCTATVLGPQRTILIPPTPQKQEQAKAKQPVACVQII